LNVSCKPKEELKGGPKDMSAGERCIVLNDQGRSEGPTQHFQTRKQAKSF